MGCVLKGEGGGCSSNEREVLIMDILYLFNFYLLTRIEPTGGKRRGPTGDGICLLRSSILGGDPLGPSPSTRVLVKGITFHRSDMCVCYSDTYFCRGAGSLRTFSGIGVIRKSALFLCKSCLFCSKGARVTRMHCGMHVRGGGAALLASDLGCSHVCGLKCCFSNKALVSRRGMLASR